VEDTVEESCSLALEDLDVLNNLDHPCIVDVAGAADTVAAGEDHIEGHSVFEAETYLHLEDYSWVEADDEELAVHVNLG